MPRGQDGQDGQVAGPAEVQLTETHPGSAKHMSFDKERPCKWGRRDPAIKTTQREKPVPRKGTHSRPGWGTDTYKPPLRLGGSGALTKALLTAQGHQELPSTVLQIKPNSTDPLLDRDEYFLALAVFRAMPKQVSASWIHGAHRDRRNSNCAQREGQCTHRMVCAFWWGKAGCSDAPIRTEEAFQSRDESQSSVRLSVWHTG